MSDLISRQAAIATAVSAAIDWHRLANPQYSIAYSIGEAMRALPPAQQWIPCSERLPENIENSYWICTDTGYQCQCRWTNNVFGLGARDEWAWKLFDIPQYSRVVAWMPLPEPYGEGKKS